MPRRTFPRQAPRLFACLCTTLLLSACAGRTPHTQHPAPPPAPAPVFVTSDAELASHVGRTSAGAGEAAIATDSLGYYLDILFADLQPLTREGIRVARDSDHVQVVFPGASTFTTGSAVLSPEAHELLDRLARELVDYDQLVVAVGGHSDNRGDPAYNLALSRQRAETVGQYLVGRGVSPERLVIRAHGANLPVADNSSPQGRAANRRVELSLWPLVHSPAAGGAAI